MLQSTAVAWSHCESLVYGYASTVLIFAVSLACWIALAVCVLITAAYLTYLNKRHANTRRRLGKTAELIDASLEDSKTAAKLQLANEEKSKSEGASPAAVNSRAFDDLTDVQNEDFIYVL